MAIQDILNKLLSEPLMVNMRKHMVDGLNQVYKDAIFKGDTNMEVVRSRGDHPALYDRLDEFDDGLSVTNFKKADVSYVDRQVSTMSGGAIKGSFTTYAALVEAYKDGAVGPFLVEEDSNRYIWDVNKLKWGSVGPYEPAEIDDGSISENKLDFTVLKGLKSKNMFNKDAVTFGYYVNDVGVLVENELFAVSEPIPAKPFTYYTNRNSYTVPFYDENNVFIFSIPGGNTVYSPNLTAFLIVSTEIDKLDFQQVEEGQEKTEYESFLPKLDGQSVPEKSITKEMLAFPTIEAKVSKNLFNKHTAIKGYYMDATWGELTPNPDYGASIPIEVEPSTAYVKTTNEQFAYTDVDNVFISGVASANSFITPANCRYVVLSEKLENLDKLQLEKGTNQTEYQGFYDIIDPLIMQEIEKSVTKTVKNVITVKKDGTGDFTSLKSALESITNANMFNEYLVELHEGDYDSFYGLTESQINDTSFLGLFVPNYVSIIGVGDRNNIIIRGELSDSYSAQTMNRVSPLHTRSVANIDNLIIVGKNTRYALHDDYNTVGIPAKKVITNCMMFKVGTGGQPPAYGGGCLSGANCLFVDCAFVSAIGYAFSLHNNVAFTKRSKFRFENCDFLNQAVTSENERFNYSLEFPAQGSGTDDLIEMIGCNAPNGINLYSSTPSLGGLNELGTMEFNLTGHSNIFSPNTLKSYDSKQLVYVFNEEVSKHVCNIDILKGTPVKFVGRNNVTPLSTTDESTVFVGLMYKNVVTGNVGLIRKKGYVHILDTNLTSLSLGDKIGIVNGILSIVDGGDYIGICKFPNYIYLT